MRVRLLARIACPSGTFAPGEIAELPDDLARPLIAGRYAEAAEAPRAVPVTPVPIEPETAEAPDVAERAVEPQPQPKRGRRRGRR